MTYEEKRAYYIEYYLRMKLLCPDDPVILNGLTYSYQEKEDELILEEIRAYNLVSFTIDEVFDRCTVVFTNSPLFYDLEYLDFSNIDSIGTIENIYYGFLSLPKLREVKGNKMRYIAMPGFSNCTSLRIVDFPNLECVESEAFCGCDLDSLDLSNVKAMSYNCFMRCVIHQLFLGDYFEPMRLSFFNTIFVNSCIDMLYLPLKYKDISKELIKMLHEDGVGKILFY